MNLFGGAREFCRKLVCRPPEEDLDEEIRAHVQIEIDENIEAGVSPEEARYAAQRKFGNALLFHERTREVWSIGLMPLAVESSR